MSYRSPTSRMSSHQSFLDADLQSVEEEEGLSEPDELESFSKSFATMRVNTKSQGQTEELEYYEEIIAEESEFVHDVAATPPTPSTPSFASTPRLGSAGSRKTEDGEADPVKEMLTTITTSKDSLELEDIGGTVGLTETQVAARKMLKARNLYRMSRGEGQGPIHFDHMGMLLRSFDELVLEYGDKAPAELRGPEFWDRFEEIEESVVKREQLDEAEQQLKRAISKTEQALRDKLARLEQEQKAEEAALDALGEEGSDDEDLYAAFPQLKAQLMQREYAKYQLPWAVPDEHKGTDLEAELQQRNVSSPLSGAASSKRLMNAEEIRRQRQAEREGAPLPTQQRGGHCLASDVIHFVGPVFKSTGAALKQASDDAAGADSQPRVRFSPLGAPIVPLGARHRSTDKDPGHKREVAPDPPPMPTRAAYLKAWKAAGQKRTWKGKAVADRAAFIAKYTPKPLEGVPYPPPPPGSFPAPPFPGEALPACQLKVKGLPMKCSEEEVRAFFEGQAELIQDKNKDGFKGGIKIFKKDGWLTGEAIVKFATKRGALDSLLRFDRKLLRDRVIHLSYFMETIPDPRGRLMVSGLNRKTSEKDLRHHFSGWHLAPAEDGHDPELVLNEDSWPTGQAVITFIDIAAADNALLNFNFEKKIHGRSLTVEALPPLEYDEISEEWVESPELAESTELILEAALDEQESVHEGHL